VAAHFHPARRLSALALETGLAPIVIHERLFVSGLDHAAEVGEHTAESVASAIIERLDHRIPLDQLVAAWSCAFEPNNELLAAIAGVNRRRALFTNNGPMLDMCLSGPLAPIAEAFDIAVCSWHVGATKPDPKAFIRTTDRLGARPSCLLLIDDVVNNVVAARSVGWRAILHTSVADTTASLDERV
jgi:HAD superfamily hydrolase (TIGR01509 family)